MHILVKNIDDNIYNKINIIKLSNIYEIILSKNLSLASQYYTALSHSSALYGLARKSTEQVHSLLKFVNTT